MAPVIQELKAESSKFKAVVCVTAQHREMLDQVLRLFAIAPDIDLDIMRPNQDLHSLTARIIEKVGGVLKEVKPDVLLIQGDTTTVMAAAIASFYEKVPVGHVEAGLRTANIYSPFPEEVNRRIASVVTSFHFAPTQAAREALTREGIPEERVFLTGNTVIDALLMILERPAPTAAKALLERAGGNGNNPGAKVILVTAHRRENFGKPFESMCFGMRKLVERNPDVALIYPVHLNPNVQEPVKRILGGMERVVLTEPVEYDVLAHLMKSCHVVLTDSGGIQEEAPSLGKPVLVMRTETERPEGIQAGTAKLVGPDGDRIVIETERLLRSTAEYEKMAKAVNPYGDGQAAKRIVAVLKNHF